MGALDTLSKATKARREVALILDVALETRWHALREKLSEAADADMLAAINTEGQVEGASMANAMPVTASIVEEMEAIRDQVQASEVTFTFESLNWSDRLSLQADHKPREGNTLDALQGANMETFMPAMIRATCVGVRGHGEEGSESESVPDDVWEGLFPNLAFAQMQRLYEAATMVNDGLAKVPTSARFLLETPDSGASLAQPGPGPARPQSGGVDGSRRTSRKSSATKKASSSA